MRRSVYLSLSSLFLLSGCAHFDFGDEGKGVVYYEPKPYLFVSTSYSQQEKECKSTATVIMIPGKKRVITPVSGVFGSSNLSVKFDKGFITELGQSGDSKATETMDSIAGLLPVLGLAATASTTENQQRAKPTQTECIHSAIMYPLEGGEPDFSHPTPFAIVPASSGNNGNESDKLLSN